ncbi:hypothetical protein [Sphingobacterium bovisgrunnientis]|uniref:hypothetical protein n=1 Tax=Sphingobacterium bovisgrunnientis TaxID=1874697 RepID=UPI001359D186|nr:hypothetical protein [Sphingobacterium bovisgrunnientis]
MVKLNLKLVLSVLFFLILSLYYNNIAIITIAILFNLIGLIFIKVCFKKKYDNFSAEIFQLFFLIYSLYAFIINEVYIDDGYIDYFIAIDSVKFYSNTQEFLAFNSYLHSIASVGDNYQLNEVRGYYYISITVGYLANFIQANTYYIQLMIISFTSSLVITSVYNLLNLYLDNRKSYYYAVIYGFLSYIFAYSANLLRDVHISLLFAVGFYYFLKYKTLGNLIRLCVILYLISLFRPEHAAFFGVIILLYIFAIIFNENTITNKKMIWSVLGFILLLIVFARFNVLYIWELLNSTSERYSELKNEDAAPDGLGATLLNLPGGIKHIASTAYSQILPFPITSGVSTSRGIIKILAFPIMLSGIFWFTIWYIIFSGIKKIKSFPGDYQCLLFISLVFLVFASAASGDFRRLMAVYPLVYLLAISIYVDVGKLQKIKIIVGSLILYISLHLVYILLKYL